MTLLLNLAITDKKAHVNRHFVWSRLTPEILLINCPGSSYSELYSKLLEKLFYSIRSY